MATPADDEGHHGRFVSWVLGRYRSVATFYAAAGGVVYGFLLLVGDPADFRSPAFRGGPFELAPRWAWGLGYLVGGATTLACPRACTVGVLLSCLLAWSGTILVAALTEPGAPAAAAVPTLVIALTLATSVAVHGVGSHRR